jgi:hypothetical protein
MLIIEGRIISLHARKPPGAVADFIKTTRGTGPVTVTNRRSSRWQRLNDEEIE